MGVYGYRYDDCPFGVEFHYPTKNSGEFGTIPTEEDLNKAVNFSVNISPNPASTWVIVDYTLSPDADKAQLLISNMLGVTVASCNLLGNDTQKVLDLRELTSGVYTYTVSCGRYSQTGKLVIVK